MKKRHWSLAGLAISFMLSTALVGCGSSGGGAGSAADPSAGNSEGEKVLTIAKSADITGFDIHNYSNTGTEATLVNMFSYLIKRDKEGLFQPDLAEYWENVNPTTWRFQLRKGVTFHNGDPFTAEDVKFSLERVSKDEKLVQYGNYKQIKEVNVIDEHTVEIVTEQPEPVLLSRLSRIGSGMLPSKYIKEKGFDAFQKNPVGTGPYKFHEWIRDDRLTMVKFDQYYAGTPQWDKVVVRSIPEEATRVSELLTGGIDLAVQIPPTDMERVNTDTTASITGPTTRVSMLTVKVDKDRPTSDPRVREAIDLAIDKKLLISSIFEGEGVETRTGLVPGIFGADKNLYEKSQYDPEKAKQLLKEAGYENGPTITFTGSVGKSLKDKETSEIIASMLEQVGFKVELEVLDNSRFNEKRAAGKTGDLTLIAYGNSLFDADLLYKRLKPDTNFDHPELEKLLNDAERNMNVEERKKQYARAQEIIDQERLNIHLLHVVAQYGYNKRIKFEPRLDEMIFAESIR